jgi:hypothetical protein
MLKSVEEIKKTEDTESNGIKLFFFFFKFHLHNYILNTA